MEERNALIRAEGIVNVITVPFTKAFASMEPEAFLRYLMQTVRPDCLICGFNYTFGSGGKGDASLLKLRESEYGYKVYEVPPVLYDGMPVSSTRIRSCVESGRMEEAGRMLGRRYSLTGKMDASGGFYPDPCRAVPAFGTFDVTVFSEDGSRHGAVVSFDHGTGLMRGEGMRSGAAELIFGCGQNSSL